jgi:hypothetical protein
MTLALIEKNLKLPWTWCRADRALIELELEGPECSS